MLDRLNFHTKTERFIERTLKKHPDRFRLPVFCLRQARVCSIPLRVLVGHAYSLHANYENALEQYSRAYAEERNDPLLHLFLGVSVLLDWTAECLVVSAGISYLQHALHKRNGADWLIERVLTSSCSESTHWRGQSLHFSL